MKLNMLLRVTREAGMLYEEMLTHCAQNVYNLTTFYKHQHFIHQECFIQKGILKEASGFCLQQETTKKVWRYIHIL